MALNLVVLASGRGSNLRAILAAIENGQCNARVAAVISDKPDSQALVFATDNKIPTRVVPLEHKHARAEWDALLAKTIAEYAPDLVVLAGFMRIVGASVLRDFAHRIVNVHPALLPSFKGAHAPADAIAAGVRISGCTVHVVDAGVDTGPILAQAAVPVLPSDTVETLHARIQAAEHRLLPATIDAIAHGAIELASTPFFRGDFHAHGLLLSPDPRSTKS